jgi:hypothetical protein
MSSLLRLVFRGRFLGTAFAVTALVTPAVFAQNLLSNGSFSSGFTSWAKTSPGTYTTGSTPVPNGHYTSSAQVVIGAPTSGAGSIFQSVSVATGSIRRYYARAWVKSTVAGQGYIEVKHVEGSTKTAITGTATTVANTWQLLEVSVDTLTTTDHIEVHLRYPRDSQSQGQTVWYTGAELRLAPTLALEPTFVNIAAFASRPSSDLVSAILEYRVHGVGTWLPALTPDFYSNDSEFRGSVFDLQPDMNYDVRVSLKLANGEIVNRREASVTTLDDVYPPIASTVVLPTSYTSGTYTISNVNGSPSGWIRYVADPAGSTIDAPAGTNGPAVLIDNCSYVIFEGATVRGGKDNGIKIHGGHDIRIRNCDISRWLRWTSYSFGADNGGTNHGYFYGSSPIHSNYINIKGGICVASDYTDVTSPGPDTATNIPHHIILENNLIHHPSLGAPNWLHGHPSGPDGIEFWFAGGQNIVRNNDIIAGAGKRMNDGITNLPNGGTTGTSSSDPVSPLLGDCNRNFEVYGNLFSANDDGTEMDGDQKNVRFWNNWVEGCYAGVSTAANTHGPSYVYHNVFVTGDESGRSNCGFKLGGAPGVSWFVQNTLLLDDFGMDTGGYSGAGAVSPIFTRNNIFAPQREWQAGTLHVNSSDSSGDIDYDMTPDWTLAGPTLPNSWETNAVVGTPTFVSEDERDLRLTSGSTGHGAALPLDQLSHDDVGAIAGDACWRSFPLRPTDAPAIYPNRKVLRVRQGQTTSFTFDVISSVDWVAQAGEGWMSLDHTSGSAGTTTVTCTVDATAIPGGFGRQLTFVSVRAVQTSPDTKNMINGLLRTIPVDIEVEPAAPTIFVFEAESLIPNSDFTSVADASASGGAYAKVTHASNTTTPPTTSPLDCAFTVPATGQYFIYLRGRTEGPYTTTSQQHTFFVKVDSALIRQYKTSAADGRYALDPRGTKDKVSWGWHNILHVQTQGGSTDDAGPWTFTAGTHHVYFYYRNQNFDFDKIVISTDPRSPIEFDLGSGGPIVLEAENYSTKTDAGSPVLQHWDIITASGAVGGGLNNVNNAIQSLADNGNNLTPGPTVPRAEYIVHFPANFATTTYWVYVRGTQGTYAGQSDSINVAIDGNTTTYSTANVMPGFPTLGWVTGNAQLTIPGSSTPSIHTITVWMREDGAIIDRIVLDPSSTPPTGDGPAETPRLWATSIAK